MKFFLLFVTLIIINPALHAEEKKAYFAGGCFWCMEESFDQLEGVISTISGYSGGHLKNPKYADVIYTDSGHVEAIEVTYDSAKIDYQKLLDIFQTRYFNPNAKYLIKQQYNKCFTCAITRKTRIHTKTTGSERTTYPEKPHQYISIDLIPMPPSQYEIKYTMLIQDVYSAYIFAYPIQSKKASNIFNAINTHILNFQPPEHIKIDAEQTLIAGITPIARKFAIKLSSSTPYAHQSNQVERGYQTLKQNITTAIYQDPTTDRDDYIVPLYSAITTYNDTPLKGNNYSKTEILYNKQLDNLFPFTQQATKNTIPKTKNPTTTPAKKGTYKRYKTGEIIYTISENPRTNETSIFRLNRAGPYKIIEDLYKQNTVYAKCILSEKRFYIHKSKIIKPQTTEEVQIKIASDWDTEIPLMTQLKFPEN